MPPNALVVRRGAPRFTAGRKRVVAVLNRHGIHTATYTYPRAPHDFRLFQRYPDQAVTQIATFLHTVDVDETHGKRQ